MTDTPSRASTRNSKWIKATPEALYRAFTDPAALAVWFAPENMAGKVHRLDNRIGGGYEMSLYYLSSEHPVPGKTNEQEDRYTARFVELTPPSRIVEAITFASSDPAISGEMTMEVAFEAKDGGTMVSVSCKNIPPGVRPEDNEVGTQQALEKLACYIGREHSMQKITTFFMFDGQAEEAMNYYLSVFDQAEILSTNRYGTDEAGAEGSVSHATFSLYGQVFMCMDSNVKHDFTFTSSMSLYIACTTEDEIDRLFEKLSQGGKVLVPLAPYPFSQKFGWVADKYGVSWQLNLEGR